MNNTRVAEQTGDTPPCLPDIQPCDNEGLYRALTAIVTVAPVVFLGIAIWQAWNEDLHWYDLVVFAITYVPIGLGVTIGFHRHLTHRSFKTSSFLRGVLAALGSAAIEGPVISWVADHRKHHAFSDRPGDSHSTTSKMPSAGAGRCAGSRTPTWAGCSSITSVPRPSATRPTCSPTRSSAS